MIVAIGTALTGFLGWIGTVLNSLLDAQGDLAPLLPVFVLAVVASIIMFGIKIIRKTCWGA